MKITFVMVKSLKAPELFHHFSHCCRFTKSPVTAVTFTYYYLISLFQNLTLITRNAVIPVRMKQQISSQNIKHY